MGLWVGFRPGEGEAGAFARCRVQSYGAAVMVQSLFHQRESHTCASAFGMRMERFEHLEDAFVVILRNPHTIVSNCEGIVISLILPGNVNLQVVLLRVFQGIVDQIGKDANHGPAGSNDIGQVV